ncbi:LapA family protein [Cellulomonas sp. PhB150]|uniref:LapA family protein n=1 Tax=Cellulomonas sp. PhB150 TaxID=2485188 RepID=UPI000FB37F08|nr:LapA family protein [Cellulomonas sp. PhB150]ROS31744.1 uncharacterized protein DUF1049 [Cellulomonas sp. PhB150]
MTSQSPSPRPGGTPAAKKPIPWRLYLGGVVVVLAVVIILQNQQEASFDVLWLSVRMPTWVILLITLALGVVIGWLLHYRRTSNKKRK